MEAPSDFNGPFLRGGETTGNGDGLVEVRYIDEADSLLHRKTTSA